jgi:hypothetical protein
MPQILNVSASTLKFRLIKHYKLLYMTDTNWLARVQAQTWACTRARIGKCGGGGADYLYVAIIWPPFVAGILSSFENFIACNV